MLDRVIDWVLEWMTGLFGLIVLISAVSILILTLGSLFNGEMWRDYSDDLFYGRLGGNWNYVSMAINVLVFIVAVLFLVLIVLFVVDVVIECLRWAWEKWRRLKGDESKEGDQ